MHEMFNGQNWSDLYHAGDFWNIVFFLSLLLACLKVVLFSADLRRWHEARGERRKWKSLEQTAGLQQVPPKTRGRAAFWRGRESSCSGAAEQAGS